MAIFECIRNFFVSVSENKKSKIGKTQLCTFTQAEYNRFRKQSKENDKFAG